MLMILVLFATLGVFGGEAGDVTVKFNDVSPKGTRTNIWFECSSTIHNGTSTTFYATNLFSAAVAGCTLESIEIIQAVLNRSFGATQFWGRQAT